MLNNEIKLKAWAGIEKYLKSDDESFNNSAYSFKVSPEYNLAIWCDIDEETNERYFIVSIRYNPYDELFGDDISNFEYSTNNISRQELESDIDCLLNGLEGKTLDKNSYGYSFN
jgi:hypothetical protein